MPNKIEFSDFAELDSRAQRLRSRKAEPGPAAGAETALLENGGLGGELVDIATEVDAQTPLARPGVAWPGVAWQPGLVWLPGHSWP